MTRTCLAVLILCVIAASPPLATPTCTKTCRRETVTCKQTECAALRARRVAPGSCLPGAPTDPDVRHSRIRLVWSGIRCETVE